MPDLAGKLRRRRKIAHIPESFGSRKMNALPRSDRFIRRLGLPGAALVTLALAAVGAAAQERHEHPPGTSQAPSPFIASTALPFSTLAAQAMAIMHEGMAKAPVNGDPDHDFVTMMIPHHQGAIDMAKALLLYTKDPELRNLALAIITEQQNEIRLMQGWLALHAAQNPGAAQETESTSQTR